MSNFPMPSVILFDNRPCTTSLAIAEYFGKPHKDVLESIRKLKAAGAGLQAAVLNIRSACRIKSRIEFKKR